MCNPSKTIESSYGISIVPPIMGYNNKKREGCKNIFLPQRSMDSPGNPNMNDYRGIGEAILVVDDVEEQRKTASGMLKELGYSVAMVSSGEEAVEYLKTKVVGKDRLGS